jgi:hypothetical protein
MSKAQEPITLELAPLPREQVGPFLLLGLEKNANAEQIEAAWAQRLIWARKKQIDVALEDINWAREVLRDPERRVHGDLVSLNLDSLDSTLARLAARYGAAASSGPTWQPLDVAKPLADLLPAVAVPDPREIEAAIDVPEIPCEVPAVGCLLDQLAREPLDPWTLNLPLDPPRTTPYE